MSDTAASTERTFNIDDLDLTQLQRVYNRTAREHPKEKIPAAEFESHGEAVRRVRKLLKSLKLDDTKVTNPGPAGKKDNEPKEPTAHTLPIAQRKARKPGGGGGGRRALLSPTDKISVVIDTNPKKRAAAQRFDLYKEGMTVQQYIDAVTKLGTGNTTEAEQQARRDLSWDLKMGWIEIKSDTSKSDETPTKKSSSSKS